MTVAFLLSLVAVALALKGYVTGSPADLMAAGFVDVVSLALVIIDRDEP